MVVTPNMTTCLHIGQVPVISIEVEPIPAADLHITNIDPGDLKEKEHVSIHTLDGVRMLVHPHLLYGDNWSMSPPPKPKSKNKDKGKGKTKAKTKSASYNVVSI